MREESWLGVRANGNDQHAYLEYLNVGEASNPGPACKQRMPPAWEALRKVHGLDKCKSHSSGGQGNLAKKREGYALSAVTANVDCWNAAKSYILKHCTADVIILQEHRLDTPAKRNAASAWAMARGYNSVWSLARSSEKGGNPSGGTAVLAKIHLGLAEAEDVLQKSHRRVAAKLDYHGGPRTLVVSSYLRTSIGLKGRQPRHFGRCRSCCRCLERTSTLGR